MPNTPETWLDDFVVNSTTTGFQSHGRVIQLSNGNILVTWTSAATTGVASPAGNENVGQIFDQLGNPVGTEFRVNFNWTTDDEQDGEIAALPGGGFIVVYEDLDSNGNGATSLRLDEFDNSGNVVSSLSTIVSDASTDLPNFFDPVVAVSSATSVMIAYEKVNGAGDTDIQYKLYNPTTNTYGNEVPLIGSSNSLGEIDIDVLSNGNYVIVARDNAADDALYMRIISPTGANVLSRTEIANTATNGDADAHPNVTGLTGGGFVVTWANTDANDTDILFQMYNAAGVEVGSIGSVGDQGATDSNNEPVVVAFNDGSFGVIYDNDEAGQFGVVIEHRSDTGALLGTQYYATTANATDIDATLLADGRIAVTWTAGELHMEILDIRDVATQGVGATIGTIGDDAIVENSGGQVGDIFAHDGNDTVTVTTGFGSSPETFDGGNGTDTLQFTGSSNSLVIDLIAGSIDYSGGSGTNDDIIANFEIIIGTSGRDVIINSTTTGNSIFGGGGNDTIFSGNTAFETLDGGAGVDTLNTTSFNGTYVVNLVTGLTNFAPESFVNFENVVTGNGADTITGTSGNNNINTNGGNDDIDAGAGNDIITGGAGADDIDGGAGNDWAYYHDSATGVNVNLFNGTGTGGDAQGDTLVNIERLQGSDNNDTLVGDDGSNDTLWGRGGDDSIFGRSGNDALDGGTGADALNGGGGSDWAYYTRSASAVVVNLSGVGAGGDAQGDTWTSIERILGSDFNDTIIGNGGSNTLRGGDGNDIIDGGAGGDFLQGGAGADTLTGGGGRDFASYSGSDSAVTINLATNVNTGGEAEGDMIFDIDRIIGSDFGDNITGNSSVNDIRGGEGNDVINGGGGNDILKGEEGADDIDGGAGNDWVYFTSSNAGININLGSGTGLGGHAEGDTYTNVERASGSNFNDFIIGSSADNTLRGRSGNDELDGRAGDDFLTGGTGTDTFQFIAGFAGDNTVTDFVAGETVRLLNFGYVDAADAAGDFVQSGSSVVFTNGSVSITFLGANLAQVQAAVEVGVAVAELPDNKATISELPDTTIVEVANDFDDTFVLQQDLIADFMTGTVSTAPLVYSNNAGALEIMTEDDFAYDWDIALA